jgi:hypothetical protein
VKIGGTEERFRLGEKIATKWHQIGTRLGLEKDFLESLEELHGADKRLDKVLGKWFDNADDLPHKDEYPLTWKGLKTLLEDVEKGEVAKQYFNFLRRAEQANK